MHCRLAEIILVFAQAGIRFVSASLTKLIRHMPSIKDRHQTCQEVAYSPEPLYVVSIHQPVSRDFVRIMQPHDMKYGLHACRKRQINHLNRCASSALTRRSANTLWDSCNHSTVRCLGSVVVLGSARMTP